MLKKVALFSLLVGFSTICAMSNAQARPERPERAERHATPRVERPEKVEVEHGVEVPHIERAEKAERPEKVEVEHGVEVELEHVGKVERPERSAR
jgi:hypothetical protein